jgi:hypothetical protein
MKRILRTFTTTYVLPDGSEEFIRDGEPWEDTYDVVKWGDLHAGSTLEEIVEAAVEGIRSEGCETQYSSEPHWQPAGWYASQPYTHPHTDAREEKTLHLEGFTERESRAIHAEIVGGRARRGLS